MCPACRSHDLRRRKREGFKLYLASFFGRWPYRCDSCGSEFFLKKRYTQRKRLTATEPAGEAPAPVDINIETEA